MIKREQDADPSCNIPQDNRVTDLSFHRTDPRVAGCLYHLMHVFDGLCQYHDMPYWADGGTLLGAVRHGGLIPWDDDLDVQLGPGAEQILATANVTKQLDEMGVELRPIWFGYKLCPKACPSYGQLYTEPRFKDLGAFIWPFLDIFLTTYDLKHPDKIIYKSDLAQRFFPNFYFWKRELFPLVRRSFGPCTINVPHHPSPYLTRGYGEDWDAYAVIGTDHATGEKPSHPLKVKILTRTPAAYEWTENTAQRWVFPNKR